MENRLKSELVKCGMHNILMVKCLFAMQNRERNNNIWAISYGRKENRVDFN